VTRILARATEIRLPDRIAAAAAAQSRLPRDPRDRSARAPAVERLLSENAARDIFARLDEEWRKVARSWVHVGV